MRNSGKGTILLVDDDEFFLEYLKGILLNYNVVCLTSSDSIDEASVKFLDLIILDVNLENENGYEVCERIRQYNDVVPVLFVSMMSDLEARLKAYGSGANDYISKPFQVMEFEKKVISIIEGYRKFSEIKRQLGDATTLFFDAQKGTHFLQIVNNFVLASSQCNEIEDLFVLFFCALDELGVTGVLEIEGYECRTNRGSVRALEREILSFSGKLSRIHQFGKNRVFYNWKKSRFLVRDFGAHIDTLAHLMDALDGCVCRVLQEGLLLAQITRIQTLNDENERSISDLFDKMTSSVSDAIVSLGIASTLSEDEEMRITDILNYYKYELNGLFLAQSECSRDLQKSINLMRSPSSDHVAIMKQAREGATKSSVELF